ncbi:MAG: CAP domain-containing protein [Anaerovoracaceae bacterium]|jgi:uncharacterized protein YkwD
MKNRMVRSVLSFIVLASLTFQVIPVSNASALEETAQDAGAYTTEVYEEPYLSKEQQFINSVFELVNKERQKAELQPLLYLEELGIPAGVRAKEIATAFSHTRPDKRSWTTVYGQFGLDYTRAGENLAYGFRTAEKLVSAWMRSESHRKNILNPDFEYIAMGYYKNRAGKAHISQLFYVPMNPIVDLQ